MADRPITDISLNDVRKLIEDRNIGEDVVDAVGQLLGIVLALSPVVAGPAALSLWALIEPKNELIEASKTAVRKISRSKPSDYLDRAERMAAANCLLTYVALFTVIRQQWPTIVRDLGLTDRAAKEALEEASSRALAPSAGGDSIASWVIPVPHPTDNTSSDAVSRQRIFLELSERVVEALPTGGRLRGSAEKEADKDARRDLPIEIARQAEKLYQAERLGMAAEFEQFFVWSVLRDQIAKEGQTRKLAEDQRTWFQLIGRAMHSLDLGMKGLAEALAGLPRPTLTGGGHFNVQAVAEELHRTYADVLRDQVIDDNFPMDDAGASLGFPQKIDGFIPQAYRRVLYDSKDIHLEDEDAWRAREVRGGIGAFILRYLESPYSVRTPLLILGHPGSGKSLLTEILAGHLSYPTYTTIRVKLRDVDPDIGFLTQLEDQVRADTGGRSIAWADFAEGLSLCPPVVILDGYDELLQATGRVYASYLDEVRQFQRQQAVQHRPVRVIVTSRLTLMDKVAVPLGTTVVKLEEFDRKRRKAWCEKWNSHNRSYFRERGTKPFVVPESGKLLQLARQPLLLLMLAIYDSLSNELSSQPDIDQTVLYDRLLRRFIERELYKGKSGREFAARADIDRENEIDMEMDRLGVAAIGMFSRQDVKVSRENLNADLRYFGRQKVTGGEGRTLADADMLLGSFFFIHESRSRLQPESPNLITGSTTFVGAVAFEFLHNTFGEFLAADFILRRTIEEAATICKLTGDAALDGTRAQRLALVSEGWFGALLHTPLYTRPVILAMIREWGQHKLSSGQWSRTDILSALDAIVSAQLCLILNEMTVPVPDLKQRSLSPYAELPQRGHLAIYSLNLVLLRTYLCKEAYLLDEDALGDWANACRPWDSLASLWRGWFTLDSLGTLALAVSATRRDGQIVIVAGRSELTRGIGSPLSDLYSSAVALADGVTAAASGLHVATSTRMPEEIFSRFWEEFGNAVPELGMTAQVLRLKMFAMNGGDLANLTRVMANDDLTLSINLLREGSEVAFEFADVVTRLAQTPRQQLLIRVEGDRLTDLGRLSRYEAEATIDTRAKLESEWLSRLMAFGYSRQVWKDFLQSPAAAPMLRAEAVKDFPSASSEIKYVFENDVLEFIDIDTASAFAVFAYKGKLVELSVRALDVIIKKCAQETWDLLDIPTQTWRELGDLLTSPISGIQPRKRAFLELVNSAVEESVVNIASPDYLRIRAFKVFWTEALRIGATGNNAQRIKNLIGNELWDGLQYRRYRLMRPHSRRRVPQHPSIGSYVCQPTSTQN